MRCALMAVMVLHGLIHGVGFARAFGLISLPPGASTLRQGPALGMLWLASGALMVGAAFVPLAGSGRLRCSRSRSRR
jgi:hypothetical protein